MITIKNKTNMKRIIFSSIVAFALFSSASLFAQDTTPKDSKTKKECCANKGGDKKSCTKSDKKNCKEGDKKSCTTNKDKK